ncbi:MAG: glycosyltransferase N-terminal domain-containing protein, partial [Pseudomonadota bacterium]
LYLAAARAAGPLMPALLRRRAARGKEDPARLPERLGEASRPRPKGPLAWLHAASVGESLAVLPLIEALRAARPDLGTLLTTGTLTSARLIADRRPAGVIHQFAPVDGGAAPGRFLAHWRPDLAIWVESELWPALICRAADSDARLALVNARLSARSARGWARAPGMAARLLSRFDAVLAQDGESAARLTALGARDVRAPGSLKAGAAPPPDRPQARAELARALAGRPCWLAASTHPGEEAAAAEAHRAAAIPGLVALVAPRHPERGEAAAQALAAAGLTVARRSLGQMPGPDADAVVLDTLGEMGAWYRLAPVAFIGGSFGSEGGHNPHEPAALGCAILHGPRTANFADDYAALAAAGGARRTPDAPALGRAVAALLADPAARDAQVAAARAALPDGRAALAETRDALLALLPEPRP